MVVVLEEVDSGACASACRCPPPDLSQPSGPLPSVLDCPGRWSAALSSPRTRDPGRAADRVRLARTFASDGPLEVAGQTRDQSCGCLNGGSVDERLEADFRWLTSGAGSALGDAPPRRPKRSSRAGPPWTPVSAPDAPSNCPEDDRLKQPLGDWLLCRLPSRWTTVRARWLAAGGNERSVTG